MPEEESVELTAEVEKSLEKMDDDEATTFFHEVDKLARTSVIEKERVAVLDDSLDVYVLGPSPPGPILVIVRNPMMRRSLVAKTLDYVPHAREAAQIAANALGIPSAVIHVL